jgi:hypothetical protein
MSGIAIPVNFLPNLGTQMAAICHLLPEHNRPVEGRIALSITKYGGIGGKLARKKVPDCPANCGGNERCSLHISQEKIIRTSRAN